MALEFPNTPENGATNAQFVYDSSITAWRAQGSTNNVGTQIAALQTANATTNNAGLVLVKSQTVGTSVSSVNVTGAFSSTYENYKIVYTGGTIAASAYLGLQFGATTTGYYSGLVGMNYNNTTSFAAESNLSKFGYAGAGSSSPARATMSLEVLQPFLSLPTLISGSMMSSTAAYHYGGVLSNSNSYTDFTISTSATTFSGGTIYVYGMKK